jgi:hypothetical protein
MSNFSTDYLCLHPELPVDGRHLCGVCRKTPLHSPCGDFLGNDAEITFRNSCWACSFKASGLIMTKMLKCSLRQCKNTDKEAELFTCSYVTCDKKIHKPCFMAILAKNNLPPLPEDKYCCGVKAHHTGVLKNSSTNVNEKTRWDADGPNGPDTEPNSMSVLLDWWTTEGNYSKYRGGNDQKGKTKEAPWQLLLQLKITVFW